MFNERFASILKRLRLNAGLTADQVGKQIGKSGKTVNGWENGRSQPDGDTFLKLCNIYNVKDIMQEFEYIDFNSSAQAIDIKKEELIANYNQLNETGKIKLLEYSSDLVNSGNYITQSEGKLA